MAVCPFCHREMLLGGSCTLDRVILAGGSYERVRVSAAHLNRTSGVCGDCGAPAGGFHHPGCDQERCPRCRTQAISCKCGEGLLSGTS
jgi:hypothetical protein